MWRLLVIMPGVKTTQDYSTGLSADVVSVCHSAWCGNSSRLTGVKTTQDYSTGVSADVASVHHSAWFAICSGLLNLRVS